jgi:hypothetical protein
VRVEAREQVAARQAELDGADAGRRHGRERERPETGEQGDDERQSGAAHRVRVRDAPVRRLKIL